MIAAFFDLQVQIHRQRDGPNILKQKSVTPAWLHFLKSLIGGFGAVLWLAALLCFLAYWPLGDPPDRYNLVLGMALLAVIFVQSYFSFRQERKASNLIAGFLNMMPTSCQVLRNGSWIFVPAQDLVVGDVIRVKEGDKVPADVRIFEVNEAKIEKSSLTGESEPVSLSPHPTDRNIYETQNMALFGTSVLEGTAAGLVINTGDRTVMGKIAQMTCSTKSVKTTLQREIEHFLIVVAVLSVFTCALTLLVFYFVIDKAHPGFLSTAVMLTNCIAITVAVLPDGLPISVTTILTLVGRRLHREMILVKDFSITETLGSATLIASDKTGTITMNRMTLNHLWVGCRRSSNTKCQELGHGRLARKQSLVYDESSVDYLEKIVPGCYNFDNMGKTVEDPAVAFLLQLMCMCNKASFETPSGRQAAKWRKNLEVEKIVGTPTEGALLSASQSFFDVSKFRLKVPIVDEIPFNSRRKFHLTVHKIVDDSVFHTTEFSIRQKPTEDHGDHETDRDRKSNFSYYHSESEYRIVSPDGHENLINDEDDSLLLTPRNAAGKKGGVGIVQKRDFNFLAVVKGAPEYILGMCARAVFDGREEQLKPDSISQIMKANEKLAAEGERVLAFAFKRLSSEQYPLNHVFDLRHEIEEETKNFTLLGLVGIIDPPRPGVADAIKECHEAGIRVIMVTGDHPTTAVAISRMVNIITNRKVKNYDDILEFSCNSDEREFCNDIKVECSNKMLNLIYEKMRQTLGRRPERRFLKESLVIAGKDLHNLNEKQWDYVLSHREIVFARTTPQQKLQIVKESQKRGDIIAVTGDGVNDAPALKAAHLGVAMGVCGSDISKEAANMVLLDDNFVTIVNGIKQGRLLFDNLKKVVCYLLPAGSFSEILPVLACVFLGLPQPLSAFLMIVICIGTDVCGSLGLVHEEAEFDLMTRPPRDSKNDRLVNWRIILFTYCFVGTIESTIAFFMYFYTMWLGGIPADALLFAYENWGRPLNVTYYHANYANFSDHHVTTFTTTVIDPTAQQILNAKAQTAFFVSLVVTQLWSLLSVRTRFQSSLRQKFDRRLLWYMVGEIGIVLLICYLPFFQRTMNIEPAEWYHFLIPALLGSTIFGADELRKLLARKWPDGIFKRLAW